MCPEVWVMGRICPTPLFGAFHMQFLLILDMQKPWTEDMLEALEV